MSQKENASVISDCCEHWRATAAEFNVSLFLQGVGSSQHILFFCTLNTDIKLFYKIVLTFKNDCVTSI